MRIRTRFMLAFGSLFVIVAITSGLILYNLILIQNSYEEFTDVELQQAELTEEIRYYDALLTDAVRAYLIDPDDQAIYDSYFEYADALDAALANARAGATSEEELRNFANIDTVNLDLIAIEETLLADPSIENAVPLYRGVYGDLKADYSANVEQLFDRQQEVVQETNAEVFAQINQAVVVTVVLVIILLLLSVAIVAFLTRSILRPLGALNAASDEISRGNFDAPMPPTSPDEIGNLRDSFAAMVGEIRRTLDSLQSRTRDLQTVAEVNDQISTILDLNRLLQDVADLTKERFGLYHAHIYSFNEERSTLDLTAGAGHVGRQMVAEERIIPLNTKESIVAQAARTNRTVIIGDVTTSETFLPHPLLPYTRSELAVALVARGQLLGVLDVQSDEPEYFSTEVADVLELMAGQVAAAINNARLFSTAERASRFEQAIGRLDRQLQSAIDIDEILQTTVREMGKALRVTNSAVELSLTDWADVDGDAASGDNGKRQSRLNPIWANEPGQD